MCIYVGYIVCGCAVRGGDDRNVNRISRVGVRRFELGSGRWHGLLGSVEGGCGTFEGLLKGPLIRY